MVKLILIGDVHGAWDKDLDPAALKFLKPDAAIFVGKWAFSYIQSVVLCVTKEVQGGPNKWDSMYMRFLGRRDDGVIKHM